MKYVVSISVLCDFDTTVSANSIEEAMELAESKFEEASLGDLVYGDSHVYSVVDEDDNKHYCD